MNGGSQLNSMGGGNNLFTQNQNNMGMNSNSLFNQSSNGNWGSNSLGLGMNNQAGSLNMSSNNLFNQQNNMNSLFNTNTNNTGLNMGIQNNSSMNLFSSSGASINTRSMMNQKPGTTKRQFAPTASKDNGSFVHTINHMVDYRDKSLDELRTEDYNNMKTGNLHDNWKSYVSLKIQEMRSAGIQMNISSTSQMGGNNFNMSSNNQNIFLGGGGSGGMNSNNLFNSSGNNNGFLKGNGNLVSQNSNNLFSNSAGGGNVIGNSLFNSNNQNLFNQGMNNGGNMNLFANNSGGNNMGMMNNSGVNNLFNRQNSGGNVSLFSNNSMGNNLFNPGNNSNNLFSGQSNYSLFPNNQQNVSLFQTNQENLFNQQQNQSQNLFGNNQGTNASQIMARNAQYNMQGGFNNMGGNQQLFSQGGFQNPNMLFPGQGMNTFANQGFMYPGFQAAIQVLPNGQAVQYPQQPYFMYPQTSSVYSTSSQAQQATGTNKSFSLISMTGQENYFDDSSSTAGFGLRERRPLSERTNAFRRSSGDISKRFNYRSDQSADDILRSSRFTPQFFDERRRELAYKSRGRLNSASTLEIIFTKRNESFFGEARKGKDRAEEDFDFTGRNVSNESINPPKSRQLLSRSLTRSNRDRSSSPTVMRNFDANRDRFQDDLIKVNAAVSIPDKEQNVSVTINKAEKIRSLKYLLLKEIKCDDISGYIKSATIYFNSRVLKNEDSLQDSGIKNDSWVAFVVDENAPRNSDSFRQTENNRYSDISKKKFQESLPKKPADASLLPKLTKSGYYMSPTLDDLRNYSENELKQVSGFTVENEHGKIEFQGLTDVTGLDLDILVEINPKFAEVYPERLFPTEESKPPVGTQLNKPSVITLYNCKFDSREKKESEILAIVKKKAEKMGAQLISYDRETRVYVIKVPHFTRYGFEESDEDEEREEESKGQKEQKKKEHLRDEENKSKIAPSRPYEKTETREDSIVLQTTRDKDAKTQPRLHPALDQKKVMDIADDHNLTSKKYDEQRNKTIPASKEIKDAQNKIPVTFNEQLEDVNEEEEEDELFTKNDMSDAHLEGGPNLEQELLDIQNFMKWLGETDNQKDIIEEDVRKRVGLEEDVPQRVRLEQDIENQVLNLNRKIFEYQPQKPVAVVGTQKTPKEFSLHKSFRVGWSRDGIAVPSGDPKRNSLIEVHKVILHRDLCSKTVNSEKSYPEYKKRLKGLITKVYEPLMKELVNASFLSQSAQPRFPAKGSFLKALANYAEHLSSSEYSYEEIAVVEEDLESFGLFNILFGTPDFDLQEYGAKARSMTQSQKDAILREIDVSEEIGHKFYTEYARKNALSKWLEVKSTKLIEDIIKHEEYDKRSCEHALKLIKLFLSAKKIRRASEKAGDVNLKHLENLLVSLSNFKVPDALIKEAQLWEAHNETQNHAFKQVYDLLSGQYHTYKDMEWVRKLGIRIWFLEKPQQRFEVIFEKFQEKEAKSSPDILPGWNLSSIDEAVTDLKIFDLYFILMSYFCKPDNRFLYKNLNTYSRSSDVLDTKHLWIIYEYLKQNVPAATSTKLDKEEKAFRYRILKSFAYQLELIGLWEYAIYLYVIANKDTVPTKNQLIREIVHRNYKTIVPTPKAFKYLSNCIYEKASKSFLRSKQYQTAYNLLSKIVAPRIISGEIYGEEVRRLQLYLDEIKKSPQVQWTGEGEAIQIFLDIKNLCEKKTKVSSRNIDVDYLLNQVSKMHKIITGLGNDESGGLSQTNKNMLQKRGELENIMLAKILSELFRIALEEGNYQTFLKHKKWFKNYMQIMPTEFKEANHSSYLKMIELYCSTCL